LTTEPTLILLASPLVGPASWRPVADALRDAGRRAEVVDLRGVVTPGGADLGAGAEAVSAVSRGPSVLVPHSGAGPFAPWLCAAVEGVEGVVFVDAGLPAEGMDRVDLAPAAFLTQLDEIADDDGMLPPWSEWWGTDVMAELVPDGGLRGEIAAELRPVPMGYLRGSVPVPKSWPDAPGAYLAFGGEAYAEDIERARTFGWPASVIADAQHLHMAVDPRAVADQLVALSAA
jgi:hypothetical protein